ncbi:MAG: tetratricopeptide repeat protein [Janthinobacterium lividum]
MQILANNPQSSSTLIKNVTRETFHKDVIEGSKTQGVLVDFWAPWCASCRQLTPLLEKLVRESQNRFVLAKINIDEQPEIAQQMRVQALPTVIAFVAGVPVDGFVESLTPSELKAFFERVKVHLPLSLEDYLKEAYKRLDQKEITSALEIFTHILMQDSENVSALIGMSRCYLGQKDLQKAKAYQNLISQSVQNQADVITLKKAIDLVEAGQKIGDLQFLRDDLLQNPTNVDQRIDLAKGLFGQGDAAEAIDELFKVLSQKDPVIFTKAKAELMNFLDILGFSHSLTMAARKRLSRILFT